jgi:hypothetical protein
MSIFDPPDGHNRVLKSHVFPDRWNNPVAQGKYNLVVIGAETVGLICASGAAGLGGKVTLIERHALGGDCLNVGCVPSKALIRAARAAHEVRTAGSVNGTTSRGRSTLRDAPTLIPGVFKMPGARSLPGSRRALSLRHSC